MNDLHGIIFAYQQNPELRELTQIRNTCSIPFGGRYRLVDFSLSNLVNAGVTDVGVIVYSSYQSMLDHLGSGKDWDLSRKHGGLRILPPFSYAGRHSSLYRGRMEALAGVLAYLKNIRQEYVILCTGDLVANLPVREALERHIATGADITALCAESSRTESKFTTYFSVDVDSKVTDLVQRPEEPQGLASLDAYILSKSLLLSLVERCASHDEPSFTQGVLRANLGRLDIRTFTFDGYAARIQTVTGYYMRSMELLDPTVRSSLFLPQRPIRTRDQSSPSTYYGIGASSDNSLISDGCIIEGTVVNSILSRFVRVEKGARVENCILLQRSTVQQGAVLRCAIVDKNVRVNPGRMLMGHETYPLVIAKNEIV